MTDEPRPSNYDLAIIGSGFGGSLLAMIARRLGRTVVLLERGRHPRFAIGESTSPLANLLLEELAVRYDLPRLLPLTSFGAWQRSYPDLACGLKRGFTFYRHESGRRFRNAPDRSDQLLVAASPNDDVADMHWFRADVDHFFVREAVAAGADYRDGVSVSPPIRESDGHWRLELADTSGRADVRATLLVDASGPGGYLSRSLDLPVQPFPGYPRTQSLYSHFEGVRRCDSMDDYAGQDAPPYPPEDAAVHHLFDGGWMWVLRVGNGITSAGVSVREDVASDLRLAEGEPAWHRLVDRYPSIAAQFAEARPVRPFTHVPQLARRTAAAAGEGWALLPHAAAFVDPLFSAGIPLTLLGVERLAAILAESWGSGDLPARLAEYGRVTLEEAETTAAYIGACYAAMDSFPRFAAASMFYFAAASYSEMARRLRRPDRPRRFLAADHPAFGPALRAFSHEGVPTAASGDPLTLVAEAVCCINVAGLCDPEKRGWYGVDLMDVVTSADKLGMTPAEMRAALRAAPWAQPNAL